MGLFLTTLFLCSSMQGVVVHQGQPISDATVIREVRWSWTSERYTDTVTTGPDGRFAFPEIKEDAFWPTVFPHEPYVDQVLTIVWQGKRYPGYFNDKRNYRAGGEFNLNTLAFSCDLNDPLITHSVNASGDYPGICKLVQP